MAKARFQLYVRGTDGFGWRFVASNNRDLARSPEAFADERSADAGVRELRAGITGFRASTYLDANGRWRWDVRADGRRLAESSRWYYRRVECEGTMSQFLTGCAEAQLSRTVIGLRGAASETYVDLTALEGVVPRPRTGRVVARPGPVLGRSA